MNAEEVKKRTDTAIDALASELEKGKSDALKAYLSVMSRFHSYSWRNCLLIAQQYPTASRVAGFGTWKSLRRYVKRGEKGIAIFQPVVGRKREESDDLQETETGRVFGFKCGYVFALEQTEGEPLPETGIQNAKGQVGDMLPRLRNWTEKQGITVSYEEGKNRSGASAGGKIYLQVGQPEAEEFVTLLHEAGHEVLHQGEAKRKRPTTSKIRELEAESIAYVVATAVGIDHSSAAQYIQLYNGDKETLMESLEYIRNTAQSILTAITEQPSKNAERPRVTVMADAIEMHQRPPPLQKEPSI